jgi:hypothetical protein
LKDRATAIKPDARYVTETGARIRPLSEAESTRNAAASKLVGYPFLQGHAFLSITQQHLIEGFTYRPDIAS